MKAQSSGKKQVRGPSAHHEEETGHFNNLVGRTGPPNAYSQNPSNMVSASKVGGLMAADNESANLISKAQIHEVIKGINVSYHLV